MGIVRRLRALEDHIAEITRNLESRPIILKAVIVALLLISLALGIAIRLSPYKTNEFEFFELDSYIEYWQAKYVYERGPLSWYTLTPENTDTHLFWYPWGRDFVHTSYPFMPMWIGLTYHIVGPLGLSLKEWASLQPIVFSAIATIVAYLAALEVSRSHTAGVIASLYYAVLPAAVERSVVGYVEKEGVASVFIFLFVYFYAKTLRGASASAKVKDWIKYAIPAAWSLSMVGWLWGGYIFILGTVVAYSLVSPILIGRNLSRSLILCNILLVVFSLVFVLPSPANTGTLGINPLSFRGLGWILLAGTILPFLFYYCGVEYKRLGLKRPLLTTGRYIGLLAAILVAGVFLSAYGVLPISGRLAWALGLRFMEVQPLVESIAEHQSPLSNIQTLRGMLHSWGVYWEPLLLASPLFMGIIGAFYLLYKGTPEKVYLAVAFAVAFYSYLNAVYMVGVASYFGVLVAAYMTSSIVNYVIPRVTPLRPTRRRKHARVATAKTNPYARIALLLLLVAIMTNTAYAGYSELQSNSRIVYTLRAGLTDILYYSTDSWYKAVEIMKLMPEGSLVIAWWDYGYGISVAGGKASVADGSTINNTQIGIIGLIMLSNSTRQAAELAGLFRAKPNETFLMVIEGVFVSDQNDSLIIWPVITNRALPGLVDWPKSLWMIRIGNSVVDELRSRGINVTQIDTNAVLYFYDIGQGIISPKFDRPSEVPLIYRVVIDAMIHWARANNKTGIFQWFTGKEQLLSEVGVQNIYRYLKLNVSYQIQIVDIASVLERPLMNDSYLELFAVVVEPFIDPVTKEPLRTTYMGYSGEIYSVIAFYKFKEIPST